jgi:predicted ferric reductase
VLIFTSIFRKKIRFEYDKWRIVHSVLALAALIFTILHIEATGYTSPFVRIGVWAVAGLALLALAHIRIIRPWLLSKKAYSVLSVEPERGDSWTLTVKPEQNVSLQFNPGQFAWLSLGSNPFKAKEHPFSFSGSAVTKGILRFTIKELGDFTRTIKNIQPGTPAYVDGPYGSFSPDFHHASRYVFIAGGVGIAPIMSILRTLADRNDTRPLQLIYGNSTWERVLFREELDLLQSSLNLTVLHVLSHPPIDWSGAKGILTADLLKGALHDLAPQQDCVFFVCGPPGMIKTASRTLRKLGVPLKRIHFEHFEMA